MATKKRKLPALDISGDTLDKIVLLLVSLQSASAVRAACIDKLGLTAAQADAAIEHARAKIIDAAEVDRDKARGQAIVGLRTCTNAQLKVQDVKAALAAQKELNRLLGLRAPATAKPRGAAGIRPGCADAREKMSTREHIDRFAENAQARRPLALQLCNPASLPELRQPQNQVL